MIVIVLPGVQAYISQSRTTSDLVSASGQVAALAQAATRHLADSVEGCRVVIPARPDGPGAGGASDPAVGSAGSTPNRIVALVPAGEGPAAARAAVAEVLRTWRGWAAATFPAAQPPVTPGFPDSQWVCVPAGPDGYVGQFARAQRALAARRRVRSFPPVLEPGKPLCSLTARWPAESTPPPGARSHERQERLSVVAWIKRLGAHLPDRPSAPSTYAIATAPFRSAVLSRSTGDDDVRTAVRELHAAYRSAVGQPREEAATPGVDVPSDLAADGDTWRWFARGAGRWVHPDHWTERSLAEESGVTDPTAIAGLRAAARRGREAASRLRRAMDGRVPGSHLAVIVQDLDGMGRFLSEGPPGAGHVTTEAWHSKVSRKLSDLVGRQRAQLAADAAELHAVPVYLGGDDVLLLAPAATAMRVARVVHDLVPGDLPTASTAVLLVPQSGSLQGAVGGAQALLERAKRLPGKHGLAVGYERRSGEGYETVHPWAAPAGAGLASTLEAFVDTTTVRLSPRLVSDLQRDRRELLGLSRAGAHDTRLLTAEVRRLVARHAGGEAAAVPGFAARVASSLVTVGRQEARRHGDHQGFDPVPAARLGVFLRQEAR
jgi:CRISPR-associated protein Cmr2